MNKLLLTPPVVFIIVFLVVWLLERLFSRLAFQGKEDIGGSRESYACGEKDYNNLAQPDYSNVFPFAYFFTLAHVATLMMVTVPVDSLENFAMAAIYIFGAVLGLYIIFRR